MGWSEIDINGDLVPNEITEDFRNSVITAVVSKPEGQRLLSDELVAVSFMDRETQEKKSYSRRFIDEIDSQFGEIIEKAIEIRALEDSKEHL